MSIKVAVRVRPFNGRETNLNAKCCIKMVILKSEINCDRMVQLRQLLMMKGHQEILHLITVFGLMMASAQEMMDIVSLKIQDIMIKNMSTT